jgi:RNA polymerase sigma factor (sigma-70 family)
LAQENNIQINIISKAKLGHHDALEWLYNNYCKAMFNICFRMVGKRDDAEDVLQDVFVIAFKNLHQLKDEMQFGGWLKRITVNECIRYSKKQFYWDGWEDERFEHLTDDEIHWWQDVSLKTLHDAIKTLPNGCRQIFNLYAVENYGHKEIAESLNISESTSKSQYHRARMLLREQIKTQVKNNG